MINNLCRYIGYLQFSVFKLDVRAGVLVNRLLIRFYLRLCVCVCVCVCAGFSVG